MDPSTGTPGPGAPSTSARVLVVDDERPLAQMVSTYMTKAGYRASVAHAGPEAVAMARELAPDVIVLDLGLPGLDGIEVCREIRTFSDCYILMLTARGDEVSRVVGLSVGADDYITKPFSARELVARVQAVLRRPRNPGQGQVAPIHEEPSRVFGDLTVDPARREVFVKGHPVALTRTEFDILDVLSGRPRFAFTRRQLIDEVWDAAWVGDDHIVDVHVGHMRRKIGDDPDSARYIETVRGVGYRMGKG